MREKEKAAAEAPASSMAGRNLNGNFFAYRQKSASIRPVKSDRWNGSGFSLPRSLASVEQYNPAIAECLDRAMSDGRLGRT